MALEKEVFKKRNYFGLNKISLFSKKNSRGQIWVETVIYTLIAFILMGLVLAFAKPKVEEFQDKGAIEQSINVIQEIELMINNLGSSGNQRIIILKIGKGNLYVNGEENIVNFELESRHEYSESGIEIYIGNIRVLTEKRGNIYDIFLTKNFTQEYNLKYNNQDILGKLSKSSTPYKIKISDLGVDSFGKRIINLEVIN